LVWPAVLTQEGQTRPHWWPALLAQMPWAHR
jgi:hypothetical protein